MYLCAYVYVCVCTYLPERQARYLLLSFCLSFYLYLSCLSVCLPAPLTATYLALYIVYYGIYASVGLLSVPICLGLYL